MLLLLYVDDMLLTCNNNTLIAQLFTTLSTEFRMKDMGALHYFLGIQATFLPDGLFLNQAKYTEDLLYITGMTDCCAMPAPLPLQVDKVPGQSEPFPEPTYFRNLVGKLQVLSLDRTSSLLSTSFARKCIVP